MPFNFKCDQTRFEALMQVIELKMTIGFKQVLTDAKERRRAPAAAGERHNAVQEQSNPQV